MRTLAASVLGFESFVALFFGLAAFGLHVTDGWQVAIVLGVCAIVLAGSLRRAWAYRAGWLLQIAMIATGFMVTAMFVLGVIFLALWWTALHYGARADAIRAAQLAAIAAAERASGGSSDPAGAESAAPTADAPAGDKARS